MFNGFVLSATYQPAKCGKLIAAFIRFVLVQLRNALCHKFNVLFHNKVKAVRSFAAGRATSCTPLFESLESYAD